MSTQLEELIERVIKKHAANTQIKEVVTGVAKNITETTCDIERAANPMIHGARLNAIDDTLESYITIYPKDGSNVIAGIIEGLKTEAAILRCSEVERVRIKIGEQTFLMDKDGFVFNGGKNEGMIIIQKLTDKINELVDWCKKHTHEITPDDGVIAMMGQTPLTVSGVIPSSLVPPDKLNKSDYENEKIKH